MEKEENPPLAPAQNHRPNAKHSADRKQFSSTLGYPGHQSARTDYPVQPMMEEVTQMAMKETRGKTTYETEDFRLGTEGSDRDRVSKVTIEGTNRANDYPPNEPISFMNNDTGNWDNMDGWHRGHVAARRFGGSQASWNIVPMLPNFNIGLWSAEEAKIEGELKLGRAVTISPKYNGSADARVPHRVEVKSSGGYNNTVNHTVPPRPMTTDNEIKEFKAIEAESDSKDHALAVLAKAAKSGFVSANYLDSPYLILDIAWLNGQFPGQPQSRAAFSSGQIAVLIGYNKRLNGGAIESDAWVDHTNEPHRVLREDGRKDRPEADHIVPQSRGGANFFCNARLVSWELNNSIQRVANASTKFLKW